ncbi:hypothetical protein FACS1894163_08590 [Spirochaetia bacterium]|nr:hypothetical protein FACS1894163_08590 [Spirochaetia bacterium]
MRRPKVFMTTAAAVVLAAVVTVFFFLPPRLVIVETESGRIFWQRKIYRGDEFAVEFIHSVNQTPVRDTFRIEGRNIAPVSTLFYNFGAGMQTDLSEGQQLTRRGDALVISGFTQTFKELNFIVGTVSDHIFFFGEEKISLRDLCGRNAHLTFRVERIPWFMRKN